MDLGEEKRLWRGNFLGGLRNYLPGEFEAEGNYPRIRFTQKGADYNGGRVLVTLHISSSHRSNVIVWRKILEDLSR